VRQVCSPYTWRYVYSSYLGSSRQGFLHKGTTCYIRLCAGDCVGAEQVQRRRCQACAEVQLWRCWGEEMEMLRCSVVGAGCFLILVCQKEEQRRHQHDQRWYLSCCFLTGYKSWSISPLTGRCMFLYMKQTMQLTSTVQKPTAQQ